MSLEPTAGVLTLTASVTPQLVFTASVNANNVDTRVAASYPIGDFTLVFARTTAAGYVTSAGAPATAASGTARSAHYYEDGT